jgi:hypothetical protein
MANDFKFQPNKEVVAAKTAEEQAAADAAAGKPKDLVAEILAAPPIDAKREQEIGNKHFRRILHGVNGTSDDKTPLTPDEAAIKDAYEKDLKANYAAEMERAKKVDAVALAPSLNDRQKNALGRHLNIQFVQNRGIWKQMTDEEIATMLEYRRANREDWRGLYAEYNPNGTKWEVAGHGLKSWAKSLKIPVIGRSTSQLLSVSDNLSELQKTDKARLDTNAAVQAEFWRVLKKFKDDPKSRRKETVDELLADLKKNKELLIQSNWEKYPEFKAKIDTLNDVEMADLLLAVNHERRAFTTRGEKDGGAFSEKFGTRLDDFLLDDVNGEWDPTWSQKYTPTIAMAYAHTGGYGADDTVDLAREELRAKTYGDEIPNSGGLPFGLGVNKRGSKGIHPILFAIDNIGKGAFSAGESDNSFFSKTYMAHRYSQSGMAVAEGAITGAVTLGKGIINEAYDPTEEASWSNLFREGEVGFIKNWFHTVGTGTLTDMKQMVAMFKASQRTSDNIDAYMNGEKSLIAGPALAMLSGKSLDDAQKILRRYGALNAEAINTGMFRYNPASIAGKSAVIGEAGMAGGVGVIGGITKMNNILAANKIITFRNAVTINGKLTKLGNGIAKFESVTFGLPAKVVGTVVGGTGRATLYTMGKVGQGLALGLEKMGLNISATKALGMVGVSSAFTNFTIGQKILGLYGFGVAANDVGFFLKRFGYDGVNANGYGFAKVMQEAGENWSKGPVAGSLFEGATNLTAFGARLAKTAGKHTWFTIPMHDFVKGSWHGAGVGYGLGFMQDGHRAGITGLWGGVGMGGLGGVHGSWSQWRMGLYAHAQTKAELFKLVENDPVQSELVKEQVANAEMRQDWNAIPLMLGSAKYAAEHGFRVTLHRNNDIQHLDENLLDVDTLTDADLTINGKKHDLVAERDTLNALAQAELSIRERLAQDAAETDPTKKLSDADRARLLQDAMVASQATEAKQAEYRKAIKEWLTDLKVNGDEATREKVAHLNNYYQGVFVSGKAGSGVIFVNVDRANNTTTAHELFHGIQTAVAIHSAKAHFVNQVFGISSDTIVETDAAGNLISKGILTVQKGGASVDILKDFAQLYIDTLYAGAGKEAVRDRKKAQVLEAIDALNRKDLTIDAMKNAEGVLRNYAEEFGAYYFESYLTRNKADLLYNKGKYAAFERILNQVENYIDHNTKLDLNGQGIHENILRIRNERESKNQREMKRRLDNVHKKLAEQNQKLLDLAEKEANGDVKRDQNGEVVWKTNTTVVNGKKVFTNMKSRADAIREGIALLHKQRLDLTSAVKSNRIGSTFVNKDGTFLILPQAEAAMQRILDSKSKSLSANPFDLSTLPRAELESVLNRAGLEHWVDKDGNLKPREVIEKETAERGKAAIDLIQQLGPKVTGIVVHTDKDGNSRGIGVLTDEGIKALRDKLLITDSELMKITTLRNVIRGTIGMDPLGGGEMNFLYNALSGEYYAEGGGVGRNRKPKNEVAPTYRRVLPYKMEMILTTKDRNGNKIPPRYEFMMTGIDMSVVLDRAAYEFGQSYQIGDTGRSITVSEQFGGNFALFKQAINMYLTGLTEGRMPSADMFGGGERGEAIRDVMLRVIGPSPERSFRSDGTPMFDNNPIIRPFNTWERGPNFAFTTFRVDLMQDIEVLHSPIRFNEETGFNNLTKNFSAVEYSPPKPVRGRISFTATAEYEWVNRRKENIVGTRTANYTVSQTKDGKFQVGSEDFVKPIIVSSEQAARDFIELDVQRREYIGKNIIAAHLHGGESGVLAVSHKGKYMLIDTKNKNRPIEGRVFSSEVEAVTEAAKIHNQNLLSLLRGKTGERERRLAESLIEQAISANSANPEMLPQRLAIGKGGLPKLSVVRDSEGKEVKYTVNDDEVKRGLAVPNQTKKVVQFQKVGYGLMESMVGNSNLRMMDPSVHAAAERVAEELVKEAREAAKDSAKRKGIDWYRRMVRDGYSVFGSIYGMFTELEGATSARTPVAENFKQAMEALTMFSRNAYNKQLAEVDAAIKDIEARVAQKEDGTNRSLFEAEAVEILQKKAAAKEANEKFDEDLDWYEWEDPASVGRDIDPEALAGFRDAFLNIKKTSKKTTLTPAQLSDALQGAKAKVFKQAGALMLRANGKKYNANTVKVGQVMHGLWRELTEGPKTPNFAGNLSGLVRSATIDVWAARSLHRIINSKINGRQKWRLSAGMETGVDYVYYPQGDNFNANWEGGGDFFFGQKVFELAAETLRQEGGDFADMMPDDLQALVWFHEKGIWAENGWTDSAGAEFSSFEGPTERVSGQRDSAGVNEWNNIRRFLVGVSGSYSSYGIDIPVAGRIVSQSATARQFAAPRDRVLQLKGAVADALNPIGQNSGQTYGDYGGYLEHSLFFDILVQRGRTQDLAQEAAKSDSELVKVQNKLDGLKARMRDPNTSSADRGKIEKAIAKAEKALASTKTGREATKSAYEAESGNPTMLNQMGLLMEHMITVAKNYNQSDVMVGEVVGENHPNARPAIEILFSKDKPVDLSTALAIADRLKNAGNNFIAGFTLIPDPRNGANPRLTEATKRLAEVTAERGVPVKGKEAEFAKLTNEVNSLTQFIGVRSEANPEMTARFATDSSIPQIKTGERNLLAEADARWFMSSWSDAVKNGVLSITEHNGIRLQPKQYFVSTETVPKGSYDSFNPAEIGREVSLADRLHRYRVGLEREAALADEFVKTGDLFPSESAVLKDNRTTWAATSADREAGSRIDSSLDAYEQGKTASRVSGNIVLTPDAADAWVKKAFVAPMTKSDGGVIWGNKDYTVTQRRAADGTLTNTYEIRGAYDRRPTIVTGLENAKMAVKQRLTGDLGAAAGERSIEVNGEKFTINEATILGVTNAGEAANPSAGRYDKESNIFKYKPDDSPTVQKYQYNSRPFTEAFGNQTGPAVTLFSHRAEKVQARLNALLARVGVGSQWGVQFLFESGYGKNSDFERSSGKTQLVITVKGSPFPIRIGQQTWSLSKMTLNPNSTFKGFHPMGGQPTHAYGDEGSIGQANVLNGAMTPWYNALQVLKKSGAWTNIGEELQIAIEDRKQAKRPYNITNLLEDILVQYRQDIVMKKASFDKGVDPMEVHEAASQFIYKMADANLLDIFQTRLNADLDAKKIEDIITNFQNIGYALNAELGGRLYATGMLPKGTGGLESQVVNREGAVIKSRVNTWGPDQHRFDMDSGVTTSDPAKAIHMNTVGDESLKMTSFTPTDPTHKFSPADMPQYLQKSKAFNDEGVKGNGSLFSKYAEHNLPKNAALSYSVDSAGNIDVLAKNTETGNTVMAFTILAPKDKKAVTVNNAFLAETPESIAKKRESKYYEEYTDAKGVLRNRKTSRQIVVDDLAGSPDLKVSMVRETIERLRQSGFKRMFYDSFDSQNIESVIKEAFEKDPELSQKGWEDDESGWNIDQKKAYSPDDIQPRNKGRKFLGIDRAFSDADNQNTVVKGGFFSKRAEEIFGESIKDFQFSFNPSRVYGAGSRSIMVVLEHKGNEVMSFTIFPTMQGDMNNPNREGKMMGKAEVKAVWENTNYTRDSKNGLGDMQKLYAGVFTEMVERLRQTGQKFVSVHEESLPNAIKGDVKAAMSAVFGHEPHGKVSNYGSAKDGASELIGDFISGMQNKNSGPNDAWFLNAKKAYKPEDHQSFKDWEDNWVQKGGGSFGDIFAAWKHFETKGGMYSVYDPNYERKVGTKSISLEDLMTIVNHKGIKWEDATPQEQLMYDLLGLLDSFSGLRKESGARVIMDEPWQRSHSQGAAESQMRVENHYYFKTTGDLTTLIEEIHHSLFGSEREGMIRDDYNELGIGDGYPTLNEKIVTPDGKMVLGSGRVNRAIPAVPSSEWIAKMRDANKKNLDDTIARNLDPKVAMRRAAFYTLIESWLRVFENTPAEMIKSMATTRVGKAAMKANPDITAAELALGTQPEAVQKQKIVGSGRNRHYQKSVERDAANKLRIGSPRDRSFGDPAKSAYSDDYHLPTLVEFAAGVLNDSKIQALLARLPKIDGDAIDTVLDHYEKSQNAEYKGWAGKVRSAWSSAQTMFNQVLAAIRTLAWYNSGYIRDVEEARSKVDPLAKAADDLRTNQKKDTLLDSAIRAAIMINPRGVVGDTMVENYGYNTQKTYGREGIKDPRTTRIDSDTSLILANAAGNVKLRADAASNRPQAQAAEAATAKGVSGRVSFVKGLSDQIKNPPTKTGAYVTQNTQLSNSHRRVWDNTVVTPQTVRFVNPSSVLVNEILAAQSHKQDGGYSLTSHLRGRDITKKGTTIESLYPDLDSILPDFDPDKPYQNMRGDQEKILLKQTVNLIKDGNNEVARLYESIRESLKTGTKNNDIVPVPFEYSDSGNGWYDVSIGGYKNAFNSSPAERAIAAQKLRATLLAFHFHNLSVSASERVPLPILMENKSNSRWSKTTGFEFTQGDTPFRE